MWVQSISIAATAMPDFFLHSAAMRLMLVFLLWVLFVFRLKKKETVEDLK